MRTADEGRHRGERGRSSRSWAPQPRVDDGGAARDGAAPAGRGHGVGAGQVLRLQRKAGNAAVARLVRAAGGDGLGLVPTVQRITPEDVAVEVVGRTFELTEPFARPGGATLPPGARLTVLAWSNTAATVDVTDRPGGLRPPRFSVPKRLLVPSRSGVPGVDHYSAGVRNQAATVARGERDRAAWMAKSGSYRSPAAIREFEAEKRRLEDLLAERRRVLNRRLIQETMFNRFDAIVVREVEAANRARGLSGDDALDPNLVKSMLFQESQMGTSGQHLEEPPSHPVKTRFNLLQAVDSSALALLTLLEAEHPGMVTTYALGNLRRDLGDAQNELARLVRKTSRSPAEEARLAELRVQSQKNWEHFIWNYRAPGAPAGFWQAVNALFSQVSPPRNRDYAFWIHLGVMWLFKKRRAGMSWPDAIRAYNGGGVRAEHYRTAVVERAASARAATQARREFVPEGT